ncbi:MAG TPA: flagellar export protein FliJ [Rhizobacter sp.]|jgi:flagellar FliJ protein|nr:flagellar export protein FliJ [Rhizobacter sp.]
MTTQNPSLDPLMALLGQAERERDDALAAMQRANEAHLAAQTQADQLLTYRSEYEARFREQFSRQSSIEILQCYQGFSARLGQAIDQQRQIAGHAALRLEQSRETLRSQEMRVASVRKLLERRVQELRLAADRRDQKQTDEFAARAAWNQLQQRPLSPAA